MEWGPLLDDSTGRVRGVIREIVDGVAAVTGERSLAELGDRALLHAYLAQDGTVEDPDDVVSQSLADAVTRFAKGAGSPALYDGAAGLGWVVEHLAGGETADRVCAAVDAALLRQLASWTGDYDLISGLVGFGVYALERGDAGKPLATRVLDLLTETATERGGGLAWHTRPELLPPWQREQAPEGYWNLGLAHGIPGVIALLARYVRYDTDAVRAGELLDRAMTFMLGAEPMRVGRYPSWHPSKETSRRLAWCYNDLGVSMALYAAAAARNRDDWRAEALALATQCAHTQLADAVVKDCGLCHGAAGAMHLFDRLHHATGEAVFRDAALRWLEHVFELRRSEPIAGFPAGTPSSETKWTPSATVLVGAPGVALALHAMISDVEPSWDRVMLVDF